MNTKVKKFIAVSLIGITTIGNVPTIAFADSAPITPKFKFVAAATE